MILSHLTGKMEVETLLYCFIIKRPSDAISLGKCRRVKVEIHGLSETDARQCLRLSNKHKTLGCHLMAAHAYLLLFYTKYGCNSLTALVCGEKKNTVCHICSTGSATAQHSSNACAAEVCRSARHWIIPVITALNQHLPS